MSRAGSDAATLAATGMNLAPSSDALQVLSNSFGFGGVNASLLFGPPPLALDPVVDGTP